MPITEELERKAAPSPILPPAVTGADQPPRPEPKVVVAEPTSPSTPTSGPILPGSS